jgi:hypothetical protein
MQWTVNDMLKWLERLSDLATSLPSWQQLPPVPDREYAKGDKFWRGVRTGEWRALLGQLETACRSICYQFASDYANGDWTVSQALVESKTYRARDMTKAVLEPLGFNLFWNPVAADSWEVVCDTPMSTTDAMKVDAALAAAGIDSRWYYEDGQHAFVVVTVERPRIVLPPPPPPPPAAEQAQQEG